MSATHSLSFRISNFSLSHQQMNKQTKEQTNEQTNKQTNQQTHETQLSIVSIELLTQNILIM